MKQKSILWLNYIKCVNQSEDDKNLTEKDVEIQIKNNS